MRKISSVLYKAVDLLPAGYKIVRQSLMDDLSGPKSICWNTRILQDDDRRFSPHEWYALGVLRHHARFIRKSTIAEDGTVCYDTIAKIK